jgi:hypothetical protein
MAIMELLLQLGICAAIWKEFRDMERRIDRVQEDIANIKGVISELPRRRTD